MDKKITRKEALRKTGITALAATSFIFLETKAKACDSVRTPSGSDTHKDSWNNDGWHRDRWHSSDGEKDRWHSGDGDKDRRNGDDENKDGWKRW